MILRLTVCLLLTGASAPCLWDYDTLEQERSRFPTSLELITGRFPRHSAEFYQWRVQDRTRALDAGAISAEGLDDLAVSYSKLGDDGRAIELMAQKEADFPGLYSTAANLGTFYIHAGLIEQGLPHIERAIEINPEAHFGREVYQLLLARYVLECRQETDAPRLPLDPKVHETLIPSARGFWRYLLEEGEIEAADEKRQTFLAVRGVLGMMRFGNHDSPVLLEALSDVLLANPDSDGKRLAARALLKASYEVTDSDARQAYRAKAKAALNTQTPNPSTQENLALATLETRFGNELAEAEDWWAELHENELRWIEEDEDVDARFAESYYGKTPRTRVDSEGRHMAIKKFGGVAAIALIVIALAYVAALPRRQ